MGLIYPLSRALLHAMYRKRATPRLLTRMRSFCSSSSGPAKNKTLKIKPKLNAIEYFLKIVYVVQLMKAFFLVFELATQYRPHITN